MYANNLVIRGSKPAKKYLNERKLDKTYSQTSIRYAEFLITIDKFYYNKIFLHIQSYINIFL